EKENLEHMNQHQCHHEIGSPHMECTNEPPEALLVVQHLQTRPSLACRRNVNESQADAGDELQNHYGEAGTAEDKGPTRSLPRHAMLHRLLDGFAQLQPAVKPTGQFHQVFCQAHAHLFGWSVQAWLGGAASVGICPALIQSSPPSILY